jgi:DNA-directed RNA polymerase subunit K/omega
MNENRNNIKSGLNADLRSIDSIYRMIVVAGLRSKQLVRGARPKIVPDPNCRRNISIALEEARRGLLHYTIINKVRTPELLVKTSLPSETRETVS